MLFEVCERDGVQFCSSEHFRTCCACVQRRVPWCAAAFPTFFAYQSIAFVFGIFPCCSGPVSLFVSIFASDTFYQGLATRTAEECRVSSCLQIFEIVFCRTSCFPCSSHNLCTGMCSHHLLCSRFRCILCKRAFVSYTVYGFYCMHRPCLCMELLHAHVTTMHFCVALVVRHLLSADATDACFLLWLRLCDAAFGELFNWSPRDVSDEMNCIARIFRIMIWTFSNGKECVSVCFPHFTDLFWGLLIRVCLFTIF